MSILDEWKRIKHKMHELKKQEERIQSELRLYMIEHNIDEMSDGRNRVTLSTRTREHISKEDLPASLWNRYKQTIRYAVLQLR